MVKARKVSGSLLLIVIVFSLLVGTISPMAVAFSKKPFDGKTISILGDSVSTYYNYSSGNAAQTSNSTIINNKVYYYNNTVLGVGVNDTWWMQAIEKLGGKLLVNNSYSNSSVFNPQNPSDESQGYLSRCLNLHDNTGDNAGQKPDIIFVNIGINDFSYSKEHLGSYDDITFTRLFKYTDSGNYIYDTPKTTCEAYAIMLHKIKTTYPDAEVYCFNVPSRTSHLSEDTELLKSFNRSINSIVEHYGYILVDSFGNSEFNNSAQLYYYDGIHPNRNGMDAITNLLVDTVYINSNHIQSEDVFYSVDYNLTDVTVDQGKQTLIMEGDSFCCDLKSIDDTPITCTVLIDGIDKTNKYYCDHRIYIPSVNGDIEIIAKKDEAYTKDYYCFSSENNILTSVDNEEFSLNTPLLRDGYYSLTEPINLMSDEPWALTWNASYNSEDASNHFGFYTYSSPQKEGNIFIKLDTENKHLGVCRYTCGKEYFYAANLSEHSIDFSQDHTYTLINKTDSSGNNTIYLYIDGIKISSLTTSYINGEFKDAYDNELSGTDFHINYIRCGNVNSNECTVNLIKVWETSVNDAHIHDFKYTCNYELTCTEDKRTESVCDCGYAIIEIHEKAAGHKESKWLTSQVATVHRPGSAYKKCDVCGELLDSKTLPQLRPSAPEIYSISNKINGIQIKWGAVNGAKSYRVYRRGSGQAYWYYIGTTTETSYLDTGATNNAYWRYTVRAGNAAGYGTYTNGKYIKFVSTPTIKTLSNVYDGIKVTWNAVPGTQNYRVYRCRYGYTNWTYVGSTTKTSYIDKNIKNANGVYYKYTIRAVNGYYSDFEADTQYIKRLSTPTLTSATSHTDGIHIKWKPVLGTTGYYIYRKTGNSQWVCLGSTGGTNNTTYIDKTAKKGVTYTYTVRACYGKHLSSYNTRGISCRDRY